jgi:hypothetical protein
MPRFHLKPEHRNQSARPTLSNGEPEHSGSLPISLQKTLWFNIRLHIGK